MDPKIANKSEVIGDVRLKFKTANGRLVIAKRRVSLTLTGKNYKFESLNQVLTTRDEKG
jgi:ribosomal protein L34